MDKEAERRRHPRIHVRWPITVFIDQRRIEGETRNISVSGLFIRCDDALRREESLLLSLRPQEGQEIWVKGKVAWSDSSRFNGTITKYSMGFSFVEISDRDKLLLEDLVSVLSETTT